MSQDAENLPMPEDIRLRPYDIGGRVATFVERLERFKRYTEDELVLFRYFERIAAALAQVAEPDVELTIRESDVTPSKFLGGATQYTHYPPIRYIDPIDPSQRWIISLQETSHTLHGIDDEPFSRVPELVVYKFEDYMNHGLDSDHAVEHFRGEAIEVMCGVEDGSNIGELAEGMLLGDGTSMNDRLDRQRAYAGWLGKAAEVIGLDQKYAPYLPGIQPVAGSN